MTKEENQLEQLTEIREMMSRSSKFISLSGFSGIWVGSMALIGLAAIFYNYPNYFYLRYMYNNIAYPDYMMGGIELLGFLRFVIIDAALVLFFALFGAIAFTNNKSKKQGLSLWNDTAKRFLVSLMVPLIAGGAFILISMYHGLFGIAGPLTLIFYGLALFYAGRYSLIEIRYLGLLEIVLGLLAAIFVGYTAIFWGIGFGLLHIVYGVVMYFKYDRS
ncbi:MAG: hypothetical protein DRI84_04165 [Bacteroidetes bacterium]|nr:MAG: hypothetical protein DRI84_04165 [Bacteroidota bacterium]